MLDDLSQRQLEILNFIKSELRTKGYPPSVREIGENVGLSSSSTVHGHLAQLEKKGYIRRDPTKPRAIEIITNDTEEIQSSKNTLNIPILGQVAAGTPILAEENIEDTISLPWELVRSEHVFALHVRGDSMVNAGILDGDLVLVRHQKTARNGEIIVALIENEATVKRFFLEKNSIRLQPENDYMEPIYTKNAQIIGKVVGVYRHVH